MVRVMVIVKVRVKVMVMVRVIVKVMVMVKKFLMMERKTKFFR
jgi:hypothetical protein